MNRQPLIWSIHSLLKTAVLYALLWNNCQRPGIFYTKRSADVFNVYFSWFINERCTRCRLYEFLSAVRKLVNKLHVRYIRCIFFYHGSRQSNWTGICDTGILLRFNWPAPPSVQPSCTKDPPIHAPRCFFYETCLMFILRIAFKRLKL